MALSSDVIFDIVSACVCASLILTRCFYRLAFRCKLHPTCHRRWRIDDVYMALAFFPLIARTVCICMSFVLNPTHTYEPATEAEALAAGASIASLDDDRMISHKLLIPARICYATLCVFFRHQDHSDRISLLTVDQFMDTQAWTACLLLTLHRRLLLGKVCRQFTLVLHRPQLHCRGCHDSGRMPPSIPVG